jgi:hypothetical protein
MRIRDSLGAQVSHIQTKTPAEFEENFRQYGAQGYSLVFGHGFEFQDAATRVAPDFPKTVFVTTSGTTAGPNLAGMVFGFADASYLAGILAASVTKTNRLGVIGGTELLPVVESFRAFQKGAREINPSIEIVTSHVGNWDDVSAGKEQALAQIRTAWMSYSRMLMLPASAYSRPRGKRTRSSSDRTLIRMALRDVTLGSVVIDLPLAFHDRQTAQGGNVGRGFSWANHRASSCSC